MSDVSGRFVVLTHDYPFLHWDLMLEQGESLRTWRLHGEPEAKTIITAERLPDHRPAYLDYEGPVSGGRGQVRRWDSGVYRQTTASPERIVCELSGLRLVGSVVLKANGETSSWLFRYEPAPAS